MLVAAQGELLGLRKGDIDLERRLLTVARSGRRDTTTDGHADVIPITAELVPFERDLMPTERPTRPQRQMQSKGFLIQHKGLERGDRGRGRRDLDRTTPIQKVAFALTHTKSGRQVLREHSPISIGAAISGSSCCGYPHLVE